MTLVSMSGFSPLYYPAPPMFPAASPSTATGLTIDATGEKAAFVGRVTKTGNIRKAHFWISSLTKAGGSAWTFSLQDVDLANGPPMRPDGTQDQAAAVSNASAAVGWYTTPDLSADRAVTRGDRLACVLEYDGAGRLGADTLTLGGIRVSGGSAAHTGHQSGSVLFTASWAIQAGFPAILLEYDDGTFGTLDNGWPVLNYTNVGAWNSGSTPDEYACKFTVPVPCKIDALWVLGIDPDNDFDLVLYEGTTALETLPVDASTVQSATQIDGPCRVPLSSERTLAVSTTYYVAVKPGASNVNAVYFAVSAAGHLAVFPGGTACTYATRVDAGAWSETTTRRFLAGVCLSAFDDGASAGGMIVHPGMAGGMRG